MDVTKLRDLLLSLSFCCFSMTSCDMFEAHPYDAHITGERDLNAKNIAKIEEALKDSNTFTFAMISDTQRWYDETEKAIKEINKRDDIDFVIHGGDQADFGLTREFMLMRDLMLKLDVPFVTVLGNHDCLGTGVEVFTKIYGPYNFGFTVGNTRFVCLNTNAQDFNYDEPVPDFHFIDKELEELPANIEKTIFVMHAPPFDFTFNNNVNELFEQSIRRFPNVQFCLYGHGHRLTVDDLFHDGLLYFQCPCMEKRTYLVFTIKDGKEYEYEAVNY